MKNDKNSTYYLNLSKIFVHYRQKYLLTWPQRRVELSKSTWKFVLPNRLRSTFWLQNGFSCSYLNWVFLECLHCFSSELVKHELEVDDFLVGWFLYVYSKKLIVISEGAFCYIMTISMVASSKKTAMREN